MKINKWMTSWNLCAVTPENERSRQPCMSFARSAFLNAHAKMKKNVKKVEISPLWSDKGHWDVDLMGDDTSTQQFTPVPFLALLTMWTIQKGIIFFNS